ncbi:MAG: MaoC/PaaZ C-terminal domain-containing protein [Myxococcales bacterium]|nr:MaoC/PaaZ C-terminal domain-containing protein [Myxococcales bacterium]
MAVPARYILHQGPMLGALARAAFVAVKSASGKPNRAPAEVPGPIVSATIPPRPDDLVRDYIRHVGGDPAWYRGQVPAHLFPQWVFPLQARGIEGLQYPIQRVLNGGSRLQMNAPLPLGEPYELRVQLLDIDDNGRRAVIHQRAITSTSTHPEAVVADVYGIVPLGGGDKSAKRPDERPRVPAMVKELGRWNLSTHVGLEFAKLTGDFNPIHWIRPAARANGFRNVINHGFSTMARAVEGLNRSLFSGDVSRLETIDVKFTRPLVLPAKVGLYIDDERVFVGDAPGGPAYLVGTYAVRS